jgi:hypothetical protein
MSTPKTQYDLETAAYALAQTTVAMDEHDTQKALLAAFDASGLDPGNDYADFARAHANHVSNFKVLKTRYTRGAIVADPTLAPKPVAAAKPAIVPAKPSAPAA